MLDERKIHVDVGYLAKVCSVYRERIRLVQDLVKSTAYLYGDVTEYDTEAIQKMWSADLATHFQSIAKLLDAENDFTPDRLKEIITSYVKANGLKMGNVLQMLRTAISGSPSGPDVYQMLDLCGKEKSVERIRVFQQ
jgi:glutamyl-tRNA synthetase